MPEPRYRSIISRMSLEEKIAFCSGADFWSTTAFAKYGIPSFRMADGPHGIRKITDGGAYPGASPTAPATCFPLACLTACSWDRKLQEKLGEAIAEEALSAGISLILGPGVNIKRNPLCGRNFEYYSEDPFLSGELATGWIRGVRSRGVGVSLKHFACNNREDRRTTSDSIVDERALRELYLPAFEKAVKEGRPETVMCAYNRLNGTFCSDNRFLLRTVLRDEWGFDGVVVSDWGAVNDRVEAFEAGLDLEMPSSGGFFDRDVMEAVRTGRLSEDRVNESVGRLLNLVFSLSANRTEPGNSRSARFDPEAHHELARKIASDSAVLLKNDGALLPISRGSTVAVIGMYAREPRFQGAGSSWVNATRVSSALDGFDESGIAYDFHPGYDPDGKPDEALLDEAVRGAAGADAAVVFAGVPAAWESEGFDRTDMNLPGVQNELIERVAEANPRTAVVLSCGAPVEVPWLPKVKSVLALYLPGQAGGLAAADILTGAVNPSGKLAETWPLVYGDVPSAGIFESGRSVEYREGLYVGYRYFDAAVTDVRFPFGHGLSYTAFEYRDLELPETAVLPDEPVAIAVTVKNSGPRDGAEIVQLYAGGLETRMYRPVKALAGFEKVFLKSGEEKRIVFSLEHHAFALFDPLSGGWTVPEGICRISVGASSRDIRLSGNVTVHGTRVHGTGTGGISSGVPGWYARPRGKPLKENFEALLGHPIRAEQEPCRGSYSLDSSLRDMKTSIIARIMLKAIGNIIAKAYGGADYSDPNFRGVMEVTAAGPLRSLVISSSGRLTLNMALAVINLANGHPWRALRSIFRKSVSPRETATVRLQEGRQDAGR